MTSPIRKTLVAALLFAATRAVAHGPESGAVHPHAHPHASPEVLAVGVALLALLAVAGLAARKRR